MQYTQIVTSQRSNFTNFLDKSYNIQRYNSTTNINNSSVRSAYFISPKYRHYDHLHDHFCVCTSFSLMVLPSSLKLLIISSQCLITIALCLCTSNLMISSTFHSLSVLFSFTRAHLGESRLCSCQGSSSASHLQ